MKEAIECGVRFSFSRKIEKKQKGEDIIPQLFFFLSYFFFQK